MPEENTYYCPQGQPIRYRGLSRGNQVYVYCSTERQCRGCPQKERCTPGAARRLSVHWHEAAREVVRSLAGTPAYERSRRARYRIEALFAELKQRMRLTRVRLRRLWNVAEQALHRWHSDRRPTRSIHPRLQQIDFWDYQWVSEPSGRL